MKAPATSSSVSSSTAGPAEAQGTASPCFMYWPKRALTPAEAALAAQLGAFASLGHLQVLYLLHQGCLFTAANLPQELKRGPVKQCYRNAAELACRNPDRYIYVEGYAHSIISVPHAWCVTVDGKVVDPTWDNPANCAYFGIPVDPGYLMDTVLRTGTWGLFDDFGRRTFLEMPTEHLVHPLWRDDICSRRMWPQLEEGLRKLHAKLAS